MSFNFNSNSKPKLTDTILQALMVVLLIIGAHQTIVIGQVEGYKMGFFKSYWIFMIFLILMVVYQIRRNKVIQQEQNELKDSEKGLKKHSKKK